MTKVSTILERDFLISVAVYTESPLTSNRLKLKLSISECHAVAQYMHMPLKSLDKIG